MFKLFEKVSKQSLPQVTQIQIICGDCAGDELLPGRTNLTADARCAVCGGRSFVMASPLCEALAQHLKKQKLKEEKYNDTTFTNSETTGNCQQLGDGIWH